MPATTMLCDDKILGSRDSSVDSAVLLLVLLSGLFFPCVVIDKGARWTIHKTKDGSIVIIRATC